MGVKEYILLNGLLSFRRNYILITFSAGLVFQIGVKLIQIKYSIPGEVMASTATPYLLVFMAVCVILDKYSAILLNEQLKMSSDSAEDQALAFMIAESDLIKFFSSVRPRKLFLIANNLNDTNSPYHTAQKSPWELLSNTPAMRLINKRFTLKDEHAEIIFMAIAQSTMLPNNIIFLIMEYMDIAPLFINNQRKQDIKKNLVHMYDNLLESIEEERRNIDEHLRQPYRQEKESELDSLSLPLAAQKTLMTLQYDAFIGDVMLEAKQEFIRNFNSEQPKKIMRACS